MTRTEIINKVINKFNFKSYLEIGVGSGENYKRIICENKECCDPYDTEISDGKCKEVITYNMKSDEMFKNMDSEKKYDVIFIDGLHEGNQVLKDIFNSFHHISENGFIFIHDSLPSSANVAVFPRKSSGTWNGSVYKAYPVLLNEEIDFEIITDDYGIGVIRSKEKFKSKEPPKESNMTWEEVFNNENFNYKQLYKVKNSNKFFEMLD